MPRVEDRLPYALNRDDTAALVESPDPNHHTGGRDRAILETLYAAGLRASEALSLSVGDVDLQRRSVRVVGKGNRERIVPLGRLAAAAISDYLDGRTEGPIFRSRTGKRLDRFNLFRMIQRQGRQAEVKASPHTLRHCFATHLLEGGANLVAISRMMGHSNLDTTGRYIRVDWKRMAEVHSRCMIYRSPPIMR
jgi:integrase/recombinase XerD